MAEHQTLIQVEGVSLKLGGRELLDDVSLTLRRREIVTLIGPNGAGKTTLVRVVLGLLRPDRGRLTRAPGIRIGYMPQRMSVDPVLPLTVARFLTLAGTQPRERVHAALAAAGVAHLAASPIQTISGGEHQRVLLARALLREPDLLILDEPVQGVDVAGQTEFYQLIQRIRDRRDCGMLLVSHDLHLVMAATDRVVCLNQHVCCHGHPAAVAQDPGYLALFGDRVARTLAVYHHAHDHTHDVHGNVIPRPRPPERAGHG